MISDRLLAVEKKIIAICERLGRDPNEVKLIGVTKYAEAAQIREAIESGLANIGENKVQEAQRKFPLLSGLTRPFTKHMIGHLQTNKVKAAVEYFDMIQSVDRIELAREIDKRAGLARKIMNVLVQVNTSGEKQKYGVSPDTVFQLVEQMSSLPHLKVQGLMAMAPFSDDREWVRRTFRETRLLSEKIRQLVGVGGNVEMKYLSMGMSDDLEVALEEGSNMLRIGRAIFPGK